MYGRPFIPKWSYIYIWVDLECLGLCTLRWCCCSICCSDVRESVLRHNRNKPNSTRKSKTVKHQRMEKKWPSKPSVFGSMMMVVGGVSQIHSQHPAQQVLLFWEKQFRASSGLPCLFLSASSVQPRWKTTKFSTNLKRRHWTSYGYFWGQVFPYIKLLQRA